MARHAPVRLAVLLGLLLACLFALLATRGIFAGQASAGGVVTPCQGRIAPEVADVSSSVRATMGRDALTVLPAGIGRLYEEGTIATGNLWSENQPMRRVAGGGFEARWWALDREGREDDVAVDVLRYASASQAHAVLVLASDAKCRHQSAGGSTAAPASGRLLHWTNPDHFYQQDLLFARGAVLYRVSDVPPGLGSLPAEAIQSERERARLPSVVQALACSLPAAGCPTAVRAGSAAFAGPPARAIPALAGAPQGAAHARVYALAVALRPYDLAGMRVAAGAVAWSGASAVGTARAAGGCDPEASRLRPVAAATSPVFAYRAGRHRQLIYSFTAVLASEADAQRYLEGAFGPREQACILARYRALLARSRQSAVRSSQPTLQPLPTPRPPTYRGSWPYRAAAARIAFVLSGPRLSSAIHNEAFGFVFHRAVVVLTVTTSAEELSGETLDYLEEVLVGRAETGAW